MWKFPTKQRIFKNILGILKKPQDISQKTQGFEKNSGGNVPQVASQKSDKKDPDLSAMKKDFLD